MGRRRSELVVGARVKIVTPSFFVRCGYPMTVTGEAKRIQEQCRPQIDAFLRSVGVEPALDPYRTPKAVYEVARAAAYELCHQKRFGGRERAVYTKDIPAAAGVECEVVGVRFVKTGTYEPGGISCGYYGSGSPEPNYLGDAVTHRILRTTLSAAAFGVEWDDYAYGCELEIEARHVELVAADVTARLGA